MALEYGWKRIVTAHCAIRFSTAVTGFRADVKVQEFVEAFRGGVLSPPFNQASPPFPFGRSQLLAIPHTIDRQATALKSALKGAERAS